MSKWIVRPGEAAYRGDMPDLRFTRPSPGHFCATMIVRAAGPEPTPPDVGLLDKARRAAAGSKVLAEAAGLTGSAERLRKTIAAADAKTGEVCRRRDDDALLTDPRMGETLLSLDREGEAAARAKAEAVRSLQAVSARLAHPGRAAAAEFDAVLQRLADAHRTELAGRRKQLVAELSAAVSPILDRLLEVEAAAAKPFNAQAAVFALLAERGLTPAPVVYTRGGPAAPSPRVEADSDMDMADALTE